MSATAWCCLSDSYRDNSPNDATLLLPETGSFSHPPIGQYGVIWATQLADRRLTHYDHFTLLVSNGTSWHTRVYRIRAFNWSVSPGPGFLLVAFGLVSSVTSSRGDSFTNLMSGWWQNRQNISNIIDTGNKSESSLERVCTNCPALVEIRQQWVGLGHDGRYHVHGRGRVGRAGKFGEIWSKSWSDKANEWHHALSCYSYQELLKSIKIEIGVFTIFLGLPHLVQGLHSPQSRHPQHHLPAWDIKSY